MSEQEKTSKQASDTAPAAEQAKPKAKPKSQSNKPKQSGQLGWFVVIVFLLAAMGAGGWYGYGLYQQTTQTITDIQTAQATLRQGNATLQAKLDRRLEAMQQQQAQLNQYIEVLREKDQHLQKDWLIMEAEYLSQLANYRLLFERDVATAIVALQSADQRLKETGDPGILKVRKALATTIQKLKQVDQADLVGLSLTISALTNDLEALPLATPDPASRQQAEQTKPATQTQTEEVSSWAQLPSAVWHDLKNLIVIRDHAQPIAPMLTPEQRFFLMENLRLQLEQARLAMLSGQAEIYQERINTAIKWIEQHFDQQASQTVGTLTTLRQLAAASIAPKLPDISEPYQILHQYRISQQQVPASSSRTN